MQDMTRDNHVPALIAPLPEECDGLGASQRIQPVERLVQDNHLGLMRDGLRQLYPLPHAFAVRSYWPVRSIGETYQLQAGPGSHIGLFVGQTEHAQERVDELIAGD